jgi:hypothetical protein
MERAQSQPAFNQTGWAMSDKSRFSGQEKLTLQEGKELETA